MLFQPTRPLRGATGITRRQRHDASNFNPRAPCGARQELREDRDMTQAISTHAPLAGRDVYSFDITADQVVISTHAPLAGRDLLWIGLETRFSLFQPTRPLRGATVKSVLVAGSGLISTHAPLAGRDCLEAVTTHSKVISTHAPLAGRDYLRRATAPEREISTHAPLAGRDKTCLQTNP